eukprot:c11187_g1_i1.p1 GENE.c11187_g1_i1~~c11187_g1_i1.p1  ORF type:complete len:768 (+),score=97.28 c11187_g1_i1:122-2425(+)
MAASPPILNSSDGFRFRATASLLSAASVRLKRDGDETVSKGIATQTFEISDLSNLLVFHHNGEEHRIPAQELLSWIGRVSHVTEALGSASSRSSASSSSSGNSDISTSSMAGRQDPAGSIPSLRAKRAVPSKTSSNLQSKSTSLLAMSGTWSASTFLTAEQIVGLRTGLSPEEQRLEAMRAGYKERPLPDLEACAPVPVDDAAKVIALARMPTKPSSFNRSFDSLARGAGAGGAARVSANATASDAMDVPVVSHRAPKVAAAASAPAATNPPRRLVGLGVSSASTPSSSPRSAPSRSPRVNLGARTYPRAVLPAFVPDCSVLEHRVRAAVAFRAPLKLTQDGFAALSPLDQRRLHFLICAHGAHDSESVLIVAPLLERHLLLSGSWRVDDRALAALAPAGLLQLRLSGLFKVSAAAVLRLVRGAPGLLDLDLSYTGAVTAELCAAIGECCPKLRSLSAAAVLSGTMRAAAADLVALFAKLPALVHVDLSGQTAVDSSVLAALATHCAGSLSSLLLAGCPRVTDADVRAHVPKLGLLRRLDLTRGPRLADTLASLLCTRCPMLMHIAIDLEVGLDVPAQTLLRDAPLLESIHLNGRRVFAGPSRVHAAALRTLRQYHPSAIEAALVDNDLSAPRPEDPDRARIMMHALATAYVHGVPVGCPECGEGSLVPAGGSDLLCDFVTYRGCGALIAAACVGRHSFDSESLSQAAARRFSPSASSSSGSSGAASGAVVDAPRGGLASSLIAAATPVVPPTIPSAPRSTSFPDVN